MIRECVSSYTVAKIIDNERRETLRDALVSLCLELLPLDGPFAVVRTDSAPGFVSLVDDEVLRKHRLSIEVGRIKNINKNPVAERAIQEIESEIRHHDPTGGSITSVQLSVIVARLNSRIRGQGLSSREMWTQRDQFTSAQLPISDRHLILEKHLSRIQNHPASERAKAPKERIHPKVSIDIGDLVYLYTDGNKCRGRSRYLVISIDGDWCNIRKFVGSQLRSNSYRVKKAECFKTSSEILASHTHTQLESDQHSLTDEYDDTPVPVAAPPQPPDIPNEIFLPENISPVQPGQDSSTPDPSVPSSPNHEDTSSDVQTPEIVAHPRGRVRRRPGWLDDYDCS